MYNENNGIDMLLDDASAAFTETRELEETTCRFYEQVVNANVEKVFT